MVCSWCNQAGRAAHEEMRPGRHTWVTGLGSTRSRRRACCYLNDRPQAFVVPSVDEEKERSAYIEMSRFFGALEIETK